MERIYLLEDDDSIRKLVIYALGSQGYEAKGFERPSDFWKAMEGQEPALVLLDIMLPEEDGLSVLEKLRSSAATRKLPVIMLTAKNTEYDRVVGLDSGADDFISKPFGMMELVARVRAVLRRTGEKQESEDYQLGDLFVSPRRQGIRAALPAPGAPGHGHDPGRHHGRGLGPGVQPGEPDPGRPRADPADQAGPGGELY